MIFDKKNKKIANERTVYETKPSMLFGCKKAIYGVILLIILFWISGPVKKMIADMQMYMISYIKLGLTGYAMLAIVLVMLFDLLYIIWQILSWYSTTYTITNHRIIIKKGLLYSRKTYMPFRSIQDIDVSQSIIKKIANVGTVTAYSAYDNNSVVLANIRNPGEVEEILFDRMNGEIIPEHGRRYDDEEIYAGRNSRPMRPRTHKRRRRADYSNDYLDDDYGRPNLNEDYEYFEEDESYFAEEYEPQLNDAFLEKEHSDARYSRYEYEEYPKYSNKRKGRQKYDYEYYDDNLEDSMSYAMSDIDRKYSPENGYDDDLEPYYNDYDYDSMEEFYQNNKDEIYLGPEEEKSQRTGETTENIVQRHFDKFNR